MDFSDPAPSRFVMSIAGYQFPQRIPSRPRDHDANWLWIQFHCKTRIHDWWVQRPCMLTWEVQELCAWMARAGSGEPVRQFEFLEPRIAFSAESSSLLAVLFRVLVRMNLRPPSLRMHPDGATILPVNFRLAMSDLSQASEQLSAQLAKSPPRFAMGGGDRPCR